VTDKTLVIALKDLSIRARDRRSAIILLAMPMALVFILGNLSNYLLASVEASGSAPARAAARGLYYLVPNLGYFNLQTHFSEGSIISPGYLAFALLHASLYTGIVFLVSCALFERREIR